MPNWRVDRLPLAYQRTLGLPFHGVVSGSRLTLPDATTIAYTQPDGGWTNVARGRKSAAPNRTPAELAHDAEQNHQWRDYALLSGRRPDIGGQSIKINTASISTTRHWLYSDASTSWIVSAELQKSGISQTLVVWLEKPFGVLGKTFEMDRRQLASYTYTPKQYNGDNQSATHAAYGRYTTITHTEHGDIAIINVASTTAGPWTETGLLLRTGGGVYFHDALRVTIAGDGSLEEGTVGVGITAVVSHEATAVDMVVTADSSDSSDGDIWPVCSWTRPVGPEEWIDEDFDPLNCNGELPDGGSELVGHQTRTVIPCLSDDDISEECDGTSSSLTETTSTEYVYRFYHVIDSSGSVGYVEISSKYDYQRIRTASCTGTRVESRDLYWVGCTDGYKAYDGSEWVLVSDDLVWESTDARSVSQEHNVSFCGAAVSGTNSDSTSGADGYYDSEPYLQDLVYDAFLLAFDAGDPSTVSAPLLYLGSNNVILVLYSGAITALTINGGDQSLSLSTVGVSFEPEVSAIATAATTSVCYV